MQRMHKLRIPYRFQHDEQTDKQVMVSGSKKGEAIDGGGGDLTF